MNIIEIQFHYIPLKMMLLNFLCIVDIREKAKGILSLIKRLPIPENDRNVSCNEEDHDSS
jgi:hypothetical protein